MRTLESFKSSLPAQGLFRGEELPFLLSPEPLRLEEKLTRQLEGLGRALLAFQQACDRLYKRSRKGTIPAWISETLDAGKPDWLVGAQYDGLYKTALPRVIRPDLLLAEHGFSMTELDSVPGGMGLTTWLASQYEDTLGEGMVHALRRFAPEGLEVQISEESADYRSEMEYLCEQVGTESQPWLCHSVEADRSESGLPPYRFFELFDWENVPALQERYLENEITPPVKPHLEEKLWLALLHTPSLAGYWAEELREKQVSRLKSIVPYGWVVDPTELPPHAALPRLDVHSWQQVGRFSQKERELVLKVSGFSELAWGSRGVTIGHDESAQEWEQAMSHALQSFEQSPYIMQEFTDTQIVEHPYFDPETGAVKVMKGRVRLCPYYLVTPDYKQVTLGGVLATINPADKKKIHGMRDAVLTVVA